jgi:hypothetical protein
MKRRYLLFWLFALLFAWFGRDGDRKLKTVKRRDVPS